MLPIRSKISLFSLALLVMAFYPASAQQYYIEVNENLDKLDVRGKEIVMINPEVDYYNFEAGNFQEKFSKQTSFQANFSKYLKRSAKKNDIPFNITKPGDINADDGAYFNYMSRLKEHLYNINAIQEHPLNREESSDYDSERVKNVFVKPPRIHPEFSRMADIYNTPYFAISGYKVFNMEKITSTVNWASYFIHDIQSYFYFILVDVRSGEVIYREMKLFEGEPEKLNMYNQLYDTFYNLKESV